MPHAEPLFLIDDNQPEILEMNILLQQPMGADDDVDGALLEPPQRVPDLFGGTKTREHRRLDGVGLHPLQNCVEMLPGEDGGGNQNRHLFAPHDCLEGGTQRHLGFTDPHIAAQQPIHRPGVFHIPLDLAGGGQLVIGLFIGKPGLKIPLPLSVLREGKALGRFAPGIEVEQFLRHLLGRLFDPGFGACPVRPAQFGQLDLFSIAGGGVPADQIQLGDRDKEGVCPRVLNLDVVLDHSLQIQAFDRGIDADAVILVYDIVSRLEFLKAGEPLGLFAGGTAWFFNLLAAGGDDRKLGEGIVGTRREMTGQHGNRSGAGYRISLDGNSG